MSQPHAHGRVLIVDDSAIVLECLEEKLTESGFEVVAVQSPLRALDLVHSQGVNGGSRFDVFIFDVMMPEIDGLELTRRCRRHPRTQDTPILLLTSLDESEDKVAGLQAGADDFLTKTSPDAEMLARVRSFAALGRMRATFGVRQEALSDLMDAHGGGATSVGSLNVVVLHPDPAVARRMTGALLEDAAANLHLTFAADAASVRAGAVDLLVCSHDLLTHNTDTLRHLLRDDGGPTVLILDGVESQERRVTAYAAGAEDYIPLATPLRELAARLAAAGRRRRRQREMQEALDRAVLVAITDPLTGLYTRGFFQRSLALEIQRARRHQHGVSLLMIDLDHFKRINDGHGHGAGDEALKAAANAARQSVRETDVVARLGGEELAVLLAATDAADAARSAERLRQAIEQAVVVIPSGAQVRMTTSVGVATFPADANTAEELLERADTALYAAKRGGRNRVVVFATQESPTPEVTAVPLPPGALERLDVLLHVASESPLRQLQREVEALCADPGTRQEQLQRMKEAADRAMKELTGIAHELRLAQRGKPHG